MIAFVTLLLGLISGVYPIEVKVGGPVAAVEFTLDGEPAGRLTRPPLERRASTWGRTSARTSWSPAPSTREGSEIARASQWLNLPRPPAEVEIVLESNGKGVPEARAAHLAERQRRQAGLDRPHPGRPAAEGRRRPGGPRSRRATSRACTSSPPSSGSRRA